MAFGDPATFKKQLRSFAADIPKQYARSTVRMAKKLHFALQMATPFRTGRAIASWNASIGGPNSRFQPPEFVVRNKREAAKFGEVNLQQLRIGETIFISNNVRSSQKESLNRPYILDLNNGTSAQAPQMYVESTVQRFTAEAKVVSRTSLLKGGAGAPRSRNS